MHARSVEGLWAACEEVEQNARQVLEQELAEFASPVKDVYEAGVQAPTLPSDRHGELHLRVAALFLKRTLVDFRAAWLLLTTGYTSACASVAASLLEHALATEILSSDPARALELVSSTTGDVPWGPKKLAQLATECEVSAGVIDSAQAATRARNIYASYKWLCKVKHPTLRVTDHTAGSTVTDDGTFVVMAAPDLRAVDLPAKRILALIVLGRTIEAIKAFADAERPDPTSTVVKDLQSRLQRAEDSVLEIARARQDEVLPFGLTENESESL